MASIFKDTEYESNSGLGVFFKEIAFGALSGVTTLATAKQIGALGGNANKLFIDNTTNQKIYVVVVNPSLPSTVTTNRAVLCSVDAGKTFTIESMSPPHLSIPAKTMIMLYANGTAPSSGEVKVWAYPG